MAEAAPVEAFIEALFKGAMTIWSYRPSPPWTLQIALHAQRSLLAAAGQEPELSLEVRGKEILRAGKPLAPTEEVAALAAALQALGVRQVVLSGLLAPESLIKLMRLVVAESEIKAGKPPADLRKAAEDAAIDGIQLLFSGKSGEQEEEKQSPDSFGEEHVRAVVAARTVPDFLYLLLRQNERLAGRQTQPITDLLVSTLSREISAQKFEADMAWSRFDPRIRERWARFQEDLRKRAKWDRASLISQLSTLKEEDLARLRSQRSLQPREAVLYALDKARSVLKHPVGEKQPRFGLLAYSGMLTDLGFSGSIGALLEEHAFFKSLGPEGRLGEHHAALARLVEEKVPSQGLAAGLAGRLDAIGPETEQFREVVELSLWLGPKMVPLLVEQLRQSSNKEGRRGLCALLAALCRKFGERPLLSALADGDHEQVVQVLRILSELGLPVTVQHIAALLYHQHPQVRETAIQVLGRFGGPTAVNVLIRFAKARVPSAEARLAVAALSALPEDDVAERLMEAFSGVGYEVQVGIAAALGRFGSAKTRGFLEPIAKGGVMDGLTGRNKELRLAARAALEQSSGR